MSGPSLTDAYQSLLDGDRDSVLGHLDKLPSQTEETIWLRAHSTELDEERIQLLGTIANHQSPMGIQARQILERENDVIDKLAEPPSYQFWKKDTFQAKIDQLKSPDLWFVWLGFFLIVVTIAVVIGLVVSGNNKKEEEAALSLAAAQTQTAYPTPEPVLTPSITALPFSRRPVGTFSAGQLSILRVEYPTNRPVLFGNYYSSTEEIEYAEPAKGSEFIAIEFEFICGLSLCSNPPEASLRLLLSNGTEVSYTGSDQPYLVEFPGSERIAQQKTTTVWAVFEVPKNETPVKVLVYTGYGDQPPELELEMP